MPRSATVVFRWFDAPRPLRRANPAPSAARKGHSSSDGEDRQLPAAALVAARTERRNERRGTPLPCCRNCDFRPHVVDRRAGECSCKTTKGAARRGSPMECSKAEIGAIAPRSSGWRACSHGEAAGSSKTRPRRIPDARDRPRIGQQEAPPKRGPSQGGNAPRGANRRLPESRDRREVFLARCGGKLVDRGDKPEIRSGGGFPRLLARDSRSVRSFRSLPNSRERRR
jgi:hypothetical protein